MKRLDEIFDIWYGVNLELIRCDEENGNIPFVSRTSSNNGVVAYVKKIEGLIPNPAGTISVACSGSVLSSFYQSKEYYSGRDVYVLRAKKNLSESELLFYCMILEKNKYRYNYGRAANKTLKRILVPRTSNIPKWVYSLKPQDRFENLPLSNQHHLLNTNQWKWFNYEEIFDIRKGFYNKKPEDNMKGKIPFIGATDSNNGITSFHDFETVVESSKTGEEPNSPLENKIFEPNCITVSNNGSIGYAFFQLKEFTCSHDVNPLYLKNHELNRYIAMFLCSLIELEQYRWAYGRKWRPARMPKSKIKLPVLENGQPDWQFMEDYIKSLPYSRNL